mgnify:FL=1
MFLFQTLFAKENTRVADVLKEESNSLNEMLPMEIDEETRLDITYIINDDTFIYSYSLVNYDKEDFKENDIKAMRLLMEKSITDMWKTNPELVYYRINKVNLVYKYNDKFGKHLFEFSFNAHEI